MRGPCARLARCQVRKAVRYWCGFSSSIASANKVCSRSDPERGSLGASVEEVPRLLECAESLSGVPIALALRAARCEKLSAIGAASLRVSLAPTKYAPDPIPNAALSVPRWKRFPGFSNVLRALAGCPGGRLDPLGKCTLISASFFPSTRRVGSAQDDALVESIVATLRSGPFYLASRLATQQLAKTAPLEYFDSCCRRWL